MNKIYPSIRKSVAGVRIAALSLAALCLQHNAVHAQHMKLKVLFLGNSFTSVNNLPLLVSDAARSVGDTLEFDSNAPGSYTLQQHSTDATSIAKIGSGDWNYVVLQEQSQRPSFPYPQVVAEVYPYAHILDSIMHKKNACGRSVFYRTWGYPDGDGMNCPIYPPVCTYRGMDSLLNERYSEMAINNNALLSPVGDVFAEILKISPGADLFAADRIHPSEMGSYAAALTFYTLLYRKDPTLIPYTYTLAGHDADIVKTVVRSVVYSALPKWHAGEYDPKVGFTESAVGADVTFDSSPSLNAVNFEWYFGDGSTTTGANPLHTYTASGSYEVVLYADNCILKDSAKKTINVVVTGIRDVAKQHVVDIYPNPAGTVLNIKTSQAGLLDNARVQVLNLLGERVMTLEHYAQQPLAIGNLASGVYLLQVTDASGAVYTQPFTKE